MKTLLKYSLSLFILQCCILTNLSAQFTVSVSGNYNQLVDSFKAAGVTVSNVTYTGHASSIGYFSNGGAGNLGAASGIILSTGSVADIDNGAAYMGSTIMGTSGNTLLAAFAGTTTYDAAVLKFDIIPAFDTLTFNFIYGSEDYPDFVGGDPLFQDHPAAFISGPDPAGGNYTNQNMIYVPGTALPVIPNNINATNNAQYFIANTTGSVMFDGITTLLQAKIRVVQSATYNMVIAIGDSGDEILDSGLFLQTNSLKSSNNPTGIATPDGLARILIHPNPSQDFINVKINKGYKIFSITGHLVMEGDGETERIDISTLQDGIYFLKADNKFGKFSKI